MKRWAWFTALAAALLTAPAFASADQPTGRAGAPLPGNFVVHAIDVGTGLAIFVEGPDFTLLYDAGSNDDSARGADNRVIAICARFAPCSPPSIT